MLEFRTARSMERRGTVLELVDNYGSEFKDQVRYARAYVSEQEMMLVPDVKEMFRWHIRRMVEEFNKHGKKIKIVELSDDIKDERQVLPLTDLGIGLIYWSDTNG